MASKVMSDKNDDIKTYMLGCGIKEALMTKGFLAHGHEVNRGQVDLRLPIGEHRILLLDLSHVPTTVASPKLQRWQKLLNRCQRTSATIRFLNARWLSGNQWVADESTILLEQAMYIHGSDIKLWEWFSGAFGGWSRAAAFLQDQGFPISVVGASDIDPHPTQIWNMNRKLINKKEVVDAQIMDVRDIEHWEKVMEAENQLRHPFIKLQIIFFGGTQERVAIRRWTDACMCFAAGGQTWFQMHSIGERGKFET